MTTPGSISCHLFGHCCCSFLDLHMPNILWSMVGYYILTLGCNSPRNLISLARASICLIAPNLPYTYLKWFQRPMTLPQPFVHTLAPSSHMYPLLYQICSFGYPISNLLNPSWSTSLSFPLPCWGGKGARGNHESLLNGFFCCFLYFVCPTMHLLQLKGIFS